MKIETLTQVAKSLRDFAATLNFDAVSVSTQFNRSLLVRVANNSICRENISVEKTETTIWAEWQSRESVCKETTLDLEKLKQRVASIRTEIGNQSANSEYVRPAMFAGSNMCTPCGETLESVFSPERLYKIIEINLQKCRKRGLRASGFLGVSENTTVTCHSGNGELVTRDLGLDIKFAVDNPSSHASGVGSGAVLGCNHETLEKTFSDAMDRALEVCEKSENPKELAPGNYTVIFSPRAISSLILFTLWYEFFDKRTLDEGRTYLSGKLGEQQFPQGLYLRVGGSFPLSSGYSFAPPPVNSRLVPCSPINILRNGKANELFCSAFWGKKNGVPENLSGPTDAPVIELGYEGNYGGSATKTFADLNDMICNTERGIFINDLWYIRMVSPMQGTLTGMTRDGLLEIRDGKIVGAVKNMRWHDNPIRMLSDISGISQAQLLNGVSRMAGGEGLLLTPAVRVENFHFSSATKF